MNNKRKNNVNGLLLLLLFVLTLISQGHAHYHLGKEVVTDLHFFYQENLLADPPTAVLVAKPKDTIVNATNRLPYGATYVLDTPLTAEQDPNSEVVGQTQGLAVSAGQNLLWWTTEKRESRGTQQDEGENKGRRKALN
ncbi:dirigent protein 4-like [Dioscorea cayenensis subsp. rotundata]|uniref:Dirigent protein n=1 Tax=Dioscorea cayennensis subsp. rotundata TaxID=55577 RepID=A0AB40CAL0_DIOCR|nr:dirigent protein 4-like [Dioscorea cayenensis subsp. rotundata]